MERQSRTSRTSRGATLVAFAFVFMLPPLFVGLTVRATTAQVCGDAVVEGDEDCDDGGICIGGSNAGSVCTSDLQCSGNGICDDGVRTGWSCSTDSDCPDSRCVRCRPFGGDGCAANCTFERILPYGLRPGAVPVFGGTVDGVCIGGEHSGASCERDADCTGFPSGFCLRGSGAALFGAFMSMSIAFEDWTWDFLVVGDERHGRIPVVVPDFGVADARASIAGILCACRREVELRTCGGTLFEADGTPSPVCTSGFANMATCPSARPCTSAFGPGNVGSFVIGCGAEVPTDVSLDQNCGGSISQPPEYPTLDLRHPDANGAAIGFRAMAFGLITGACTGATSSRGSDGEFCTGDDPESVRGTLQAQAVTTGAVQVRVANSGNLPGADLGPHTYFGFAFSCDAITESDDLGGAILVSGRTQCDGSPLPNDLVLIEALPADPSSVGPIPTPRPTHTATPTAIDTMTATATATATETATPEPATPTAISPSTTPTTVAEFTPDPTVTQSPQAATETPSPIATEQMTPSPEASPATSESPTPSQTPTVEAVATETASPTPEAETTPTETPTQLESPSVTPTTEPTPEESPTATASVPPVSTPTPEPSASPTPEAACPGDCNGDGVVTVDEIVRAVAIALGIDALEACPASDGNGDGQVTVDELLRSVAMALDGCGSAAPENG